jgi:arylsulfatase A-like enzyme
MAPEARLADMIMKRPADAGQTVCRPQASEDPDMSLHAVGRSRRRVIAVMALLVSAIAAPSCGARYLRSATVPAPAGSQPAASVTRHVIVVSIDGLRPDAIDAYGAPTLQRLMREGSYTLSASTILPSRTLPSHTSMLTGQPPEVHGVLWNHVPTANARSIDVPNVFSLARAHGYTTAAFFSKAKFQPLQRRGTLDYSQAPGGWFGRWSSARTVDDVAGYLAGATPNLLFVHLADPDTAGHNGGWMTPEYGRGVLAADASLRRLLELAEDAYGGGQFSVIVTADHGGHDKGHGTEDPRDVTIPWIAWGRGVRPGVIDTAAVRTMDTASTVLWLLGVSEPADWAGEAVIGAYDGGRAAIE